MADSLQNKERRRRSGGPRTVAGKARALANLELGKWRPGVSGNPAGRPSAGAAFAEWCNVMQDWTKARLDEVRNDPEQPAIKRAAAHQVADMAEGGVGSLDRVCDRTEGKPQQPHTFGPDDSLKDVLTDPHSAELGNALARRLAAAHQPGGNGESAN